MVLFGALAGLACHGEPTGNEGTPTSIIAKPEVVFVSQGASEAVIVTVVDEDGQALQADFTVSNVGAGITVVEDTTFLQVTSANQIRRQARFFVTGGDLTATSFVVSALGVSDTIQVTSVPATLAATFSDTLPALGDTISITAAPGTFFTESSVLTFEGAAPVVVSQDASTIVFIPFPNINGPAGVSDVGVTSNPSLTFDLATTSRVKTDSVVDIGANVVPLAPALGGTVTLTLPVALRAIPESIAATGVGADTIPRGLSIAGSPVLPRDVTLSADSLTITFVPPPNADSFVVVPGVIAQRLPMYPLELATTARVTAAVVDSIPATLSATAPAVNEVVTLTRTDAAFTFDPDAVLLVGADALSVVTARAADGSSISFVPRPLAAGNVSVDGVTIVGFSLTLPAQAPPITVGPATPIAGTGDPATAPALPVPAAAGQATATFDDAVFTAADITGDGGVGAQYYTITLGAPATLTISISSTAGEPDLDGVICNDTACSAPDFTLASTAHDESAAVALAAGTHILAVVNFDGVATDYINVTIAR
ncbi:MAG TPA: hypothetical protein VFS51_02700 [Gemmatimonadales bacterium]|nr:hypothetical protein [Gemmatimonadales bacterium]